MDDAEDLGADIEELAAIVGLYAQVVRSLIIALASEGALTTSDLQEIASGVDKVPNHFSLSARVENHLAALVELLAALRAER